MASNNHASVAERLPFLTLNESNPAPFRRRDIMSSSELSDWAADEKDSWPRELDSLYDAYMGLLDNEIRRAWVGPLQNIKAFSNMANCIKVISYVPHP